MAVAERSQVRISVWLGLGLILWAASGCQRGEIGDPPREGIARPGAPSPGSPGSRAPGTPGMPGGTLPMPDACAGAAVDVPYVPLQRMTGGQFLNTERTIFAQPTIQFPLEAGSTTNITAIEAQKINDAALALVATGGHYSYAPCDVHGPASDSCAQGFIQAFGQKAFRRPVAQDETAWLLGVYQSAIGIPNVTPAIAFQDAIDVVAQVIVQSPQHLYLSPLGVADASLPTGLLRMTGYERATRISYTLTNSTPDDPLLAAAAGGQLDTADGVRSQAARLLDAASGHAIVKDFGASYAGINATLALPALETLPKDDQHFSYDDAALRAAMRTETEALFERIFYGSGSFSDLMTSTDAYVNGPLAQLYGVSGGPTDPSTFAWVSLDGNQRAGLFTRAGFLAEFATQRYQSPIRRGVHIYRDTLCLAIPPPPPNVNTTPPAPSNNGMQVMSVRQQTEQRTSAAFCQGCHGQFDPVGFTFENYDAMGAWQTTDTGTTASGMPFSVPVDSNVTIPMSDLAGMVSGGVGISAKLAASREARDCMTKKWFTYAMGRAPAQEDACTVSNIASSFAASSDQHALVLDVMSSAPMLYVRASN
jgi:hypothetical protein